MVTGLVSPIAALRCRLSLVQRLSMDTSCFLQDALETRLIVHVITSVHTCLFQRDGRKSGCADADATRFTGRNAFPDASPEKLSSTRTARNGAHNKNLASGRCGSR